MIEFLDPLYLKQQLDRLDVNLSSLSSEATLSAFSGKFPAAAALADNMANPTTTVVGAALLGWNGTNWRRLLVDTSGLLRINAEVVANPPNLDVALSTRASEASLTRIQQDVTGTGDWRLKIRNDENLANLDVGLSTRLSESTFTARVPVLNVVSGVDVAGSSMNALAVIPQYIPSRNAYEIVDIAVGTTESSTTIAAPGAKILMIRNKGNTDVQVGLNGPVPTSNPLIVRARTVKVIVHKGVTSISYKTAAGSSTIDISYIN